MAVHFDEKTSKYSQCLQSGAGMDDFDKFGVTLVLPECAFTAELQKDSLQEMLTNIDLQLTEQGAPDSSDARSEIMVDNALAISRAIASDDIDHNEGVADIAYSFVYAFGKTVGFDKMVDLRGLTGILSNDHLTLNPCMNDGEYLRETSLLQNQMADQIDHDAWDFEPLAATVH